MTNKTAIVLLSLTLFGTGCAFEADVAPPEHGEALTEQEVGVPAADPHRYIAPARAVESYDVVEPELPSAFDPTQSHDDVTPTAPSAAGADDIEAKRVGENTSCVVHWTDPETRQVLTIPCRWEARAVESYDVVELELPSAFDPTQSHDDVTPTAPSAAGADDIEAKRAGDTSCIVTWTDPETEQVVSVPCRYAAELAAD